MPDAWFPGLCFLIGMAIGAVIMYFQNRDTIKRQQYQNMKFVDMVTDLAVKNIKLNKVANRLITINKKILDKR